MKKNKTSHGAIPRGLEKVLSSRLRAGLFGRMFRHLPPLEMADHFLLKGNLFNWRFFMKNYHGFSMIEFEDFHLCGGGRRG